MKKLGSTLLRYDTLPSTNDLAREMALSGASHGVGVLARAQTAGRGRQGRSWSSPMNEGLYFSLILRPSLKPADAPRITLAAAVAVAETLAVDFGLAVDIKWPNDVLIGGRKVCGILVESATEGDELQYAVLGIGVNLAQSDFPEEIRETATSIFLESGLRLSPDDFLPPLLDRLEGWYRSAIYQPSHVIARWSELSSYGQGCPVRVSSLDGVACGVTRGLTANGALLVELEGGEVREIVSGEITLRKGSGVGGQGPGHTSL